jgi:hypothetical protein
MSRINKWKNAVIVTSIFCVLSGIAVAFTAYNETVGIKLIIDEYETYGQVVTATESYLLGLDDAYASSSGFLLVATIASIFSIIGWTHAIAKYAHEIQPEKMRFSTGWAIGAWFVPILNLFRPRQIITDSVSIISPKRTNGLIGVWWLLFVVDNFLSQGLDRIVSTAVAKYSFVSSWQSFLNVSSEVNTAYLLVSGYALLGTSLPILIIIIVFKSAPTTDSNTHLSEGTSTHTEN